jgi:hypothetical protein
LPTSAEKSDNVIRVPVLSPIDVSLASVPVVALPSPSPSQGGGGDGTKEARADPHEALFQELLPYFNGQLHMAEICWRENLHMSDLEALCAAKADRIIQVSAEPADI